MKLVHYEMHINNSSPDFPGFDKETPVTSGRLWKLQQPFPSPLPLWRGRPGRGCWAADLNTTDGGWCCEACHA